MDLKRVIVMVRDPKEKQARISMRNEILEAAKTFTEVKIIDAPDDMYIALIECSEKTKEKLKEMFPGALMSDETIINLPQNPTPKPRDPKLN